VSHHKIGIRWEDLCCRLEPEVRARIFREAQDDKTGIASLVTVRRLAMKALADEEQALELRKRSSVSLLHSPERCGAEDTTPTRD